MSIIVITVRDNHVVNAIRCSTQEAALNVFYALAKDIGADVSKVDTEFPTVEIPNGSITVRWVN